MEESEICDFIRKRKRILFTNLPKCFTLPIIHDINMFIVYQSMDIPLTFGVASLPSVLDIRPGIESLDP